MQTPQVQDQEEAHSTKLNRTGSLYKIASCWASWFIFIEKINEHKINMKIWLETNSKTNGSENLSLLCVSNLAVVFHFMLINNLFCGPKEKIRLFVLLYF